MIRRFATAKNYQYPIIIFFILIRMSTLNASVLNTLSHDAMMALYDFRFHHADSLIQNMEEAFPDHYLPHLTRANYYWWKIITDNPDPGQQQLYLASLTNAENITRQLVNEKQYDYADVFHFINLYALRARLDLVNGEYMKALRHMKNCVDYIRLSLGKEENNENFYLTSGLYNFMTEYGSRRYPILFLYTFMYPRGNMSLGISQLKTATSSNNRVLQTEARYFLMKIFLELEQDHQKALEHAVWLTGKYPGNLIYLYHYYEILSLNNLEINAKEVRKNFFEEIQSNYQLSSRQRQYLRNLL